MQWLKKSFRKTAHDCENWPLCNFPQRADSPSYEHWWWFSSSRSLDCKWECIWQSGHGVTVNMNFVLCLAVTYVHVSYLACDIEEVNPNIPSCLSQRVSTLIPPFLLRVTDLSYEEKLNEWVLKGLGSLMRRTPPPIIRGGEETPPGGRRVVRLGRKACGGGGGGYKGERREGTFQKRKGPVAWLRANWSRLCNAFQMGSYFGYAVAATDINGDGWVDAVTLSHVKK